MKKNKIISITLATTNFIVCLCLLIFLTPSQVPLLVGMHDKIILIGSKWWLILGLAAPLVFMTINLITKNKHLQLSLMELIIFIAYCNMLGFSYFCTESNFAIGNVTKVSISLAIFLPLSLWMFVYGVVIKNISYKNKFGLRSKNTETTEFIWRQTHITASYHFRLWGLILFIVSLIFTALHLPLIELIIFVLGIAIPRIYVEVQAKKMTQKYQDMKSKQEKLKKK